MTIIIDTAGWEQIEKNLVVSASIALLYKAGLKYDKISYDGKITITIENPSSDPKKILTADLIHAEIKKTLDAEEQQAAIIDAEFKARQDALAVNELVAVKVADVASKVDAVKDLAEMKTLLKTILTYVIAKEPFNG